MAAKLYANTATKELIMTLAPDVNDQVHLDVQIDVWSALQVDWENDVNLRKHTFPLVAIGGQTISSGKLGTTYVLAEPWHIHPYEANHDFFIDGNLFTEFATTALVQQSVGAYTITVVRNLSTLVEVVESGVSGLTPEESADLSLMRKMATNRAELGVDEVVTYDDDDLTVLLTQSMADKNDGDITLRDGDPAKRGKGV